ncbi:MAG TPA: prepilin peptidase [archaeon]|nr:prepilin peptidase [archaeon]
MIEAALFAIGVIGFGLAGYLDLKKTEFPGWIPYGLIAASVLVFSLDGLITGGFSLLTNSVLYGLVFLAIGLGLYFSRQWGDGDAWLLGALGFALPSRLIFPEQASITPFYFALFFNFLVVALVYTIVYSIALGFRDVKTRKRFFSEAEKGLRYKIVSIIVVAVAFLAVYFYLSSISTWTAAYVLLLPPLFAFFVFFTDYTRIMEKHVFRKKVLTKNLRPGDVVLGGKWRGLTKQDIKKIRKKYVIVKEGIRLAPVFLITFLLTVLFGALVWFV